MKKNFIRAAVVIGLAAAVVVPGGFVALAVLGKTFPLHRTALLKLFR